MAKAWAIAGPGAPSPRGYLVEVDRWRRARDAWVAQVFRDARRGSPSSPSGALLDWLTRQEPPPPPDVRAILRANRAATRTAVRAARQGMVRAGASSAVLADVLGTTLGSGGLLDLNDTPFGGIEVSTVEGWAREGASLVSAISNAEIDDLSRRITEAASKGDRWETMAKALEEGGRYQRARARLIARDQTSKLNGKLTQELQTRAGVSRYWWRTSRNARVRPSHQAVADQLWTWALGAPGVGTSGEHDHPGGPIQCFTGDTVVRFTGLERVYRRDYAGPLVTVQTELGALRGTPNHPVLTLRGWVPLEQLKHGDQVVQHPRNASGLGHQNWHESRLDEVWDLFQRVGPRDTLAAGFHGDSSPNDQVDVAWADRGLESDGGTAAHQLIAKLDLSRADKLAASMGDGRHVGGAFRRASAGFIGGGNASDSLGFGHARLHGVHGFGPAASVASMLDEPPPEHGAADSYFEGQRIDRLSGRVPTCKVVESGRSQEFRGQVYNLQTESGWYVTSALSAVVHNCRCTAEPELPTWLRGRRSSRRGSVSRVGSTA